MSNALNSREEMDRLHALGLMMPREDWEKGYDEEDDNLDWLTPEVKAMLDKEVEEIESGIGELAPFEEMMANLRMHAQLRKERKEEFEYA